jgi:hypothetical protein
MKQVFFLVIFFFTCKIGFGQPEFAPIGAEWYYSQYESFMPPMANYIKHVCIKDSTIAGKRVKVIQKTKYKYGGVSVSMGFEYLYQSGDTISYWKGGEFHVLYNFSLSKGDSILLYSEMPNGCLDKTPYGWSSIDSAYSTMVNNHTLKAYFSIHKERSVWGFDGWPIIEKIGSTRYLLPQNTDCIMDMIGIGILRCYSDPELGTFYYEKLPCDTITTYPDGFTETNRNSRIKLYLNPVVDELIIECGEACGNFNFDIFDLSGKPINSHTFNPGERINLSFLRQGLYLIIIYNNNKLYDNGIIYKK